MLQQHRGLGSLLHWGKDLLEKIPKFVRTVRYIELAIVKLHNSCPYLDEIQILLVLLHIAHQRPPEHHLV